MSLFVRPIPAPRYWRELTYHPLSELVDFGAGISTKALTANMAEHGYDKSEMIVLAKGDSGKLEIADGRHKYQSAKEADVIPSFGLFVGKNLADWITSRKLNRQHLTTAERARAADIMSRKRPGEEPATSQAKAAETMRVSRTLVNQAAKIRVSGIPAVQRAWHDKRLSTADAAELADMPQDKQPAALKAKLEGKPPTRVRTKTVKSGAVAFDEGLWNGSLGSLYRQLDTYAIAHELVTKNDAVRICSEHQGILRLLEEANDGFKAWRKKLDSQPEGRATR